MLPSTVVFFGDIDIQSNPQPALFKTWYLLPPVRLETITLRTQIIHIAFQIQKEYPLPSFT